MFIKYYFSYSTISHDANTSIHLIVTIIINQTIYMLIIMDFLRINNLQITNTNRCYKPNVAAITSVITIINFLYLIIVIHLLPNKLLGLNIVLMNN
jgi:hypothetical protein